VGVSLTILAHILGYGIQTDYYQYSNHAAANAKRRMHESCPITWCSFAGVATAISG
jgi:hypothetical protein